MFRRDQKTIIVIWTVAAISACGPVAPAALTYEADVKPIVEEKCAGCHRQGGIAPFSLTRFDEVTRLLTTLIAASLEFVESV